MESLKMKKKSHCFQIFFSNFLIRWWSKETFWKWSTFHNFNCTFTVSWCCCSQGDSLVLRKRGRGIFFSLELFFHLSVCEKCFLRCSDFVCWWSFATAWCVAILFVMHQCATTCPWVFVFFLVKFQGLGASVLNLHSVCVFDVCYINAALRLR